EARIPTRQPQIRHEGTKTKSFYCLSLNPKSKILNPEKDYRFTQKPMEFQRLVRWSIKKTPQQKMPFVI
ncbi:MAG: hypothetical protein P8Z50_07885, partial [candidate division WOR-3 bacterium]